MKSVRAIKLKLTSNNPKLLEVAVAYQEACNWLSEIIFNRGKPCTPASLSREFYGTVRNKFHIPSQVTCSLFRHVVGTYRTMKSNKQWNLAIYKKLNVPICWKRDFNIIHNNLTIWGTKTDYKSKSIPIGELGDSKLKLIKKQWYIVLTVHIDIPEPKTTGTIVGVDSGQKNLLTAVDLKSNKTLYIRGGTLNHRRLCIRQTRAKVASVGTRSAHRLLQRLSGREKAVTHQMLHVASKQLVTFAQSVGARTLVMEDLTGIRENKKKIHHKQKARNYRWPFALCQLFVSYKANAVGIGMEFVSPANTSRRCPKCGHIDKSNRNGLEFRCVSCNHQDNADRNGGVNIASRSLLQRLAVEERAVVNPLIVANEGNSASLATNQFPCGSGN